MQLQKTSTEKEHRSARVKRTKFLFYFVTAFLTSGALLVIELVAARIIAPYVGVSLYTWTTIIGVILAGLSIGNWLGGYWADQGHSEKRVGTIIFCSGLFTFLSLFLIQPIASQVQAQSFSLLTSTFIYVLGLFLFPAIFLGVITPMLTTLAARQSKNIGRIIGGMHSLAALGSITGVFLTGYILVQYFGSRQVILGVAILLFLLSIPFLFKEKQNVYAAGIAILFISMIITFLSYKMLFVDVCKKESAYYCINVVDRSEDVTFGTAKGLVIDHLLHGINHASEPGYLVAAFAQAIDEIVYTQFKKDYHNNLKYFFAGGGSYTLPRAIKATDYTSVITVAEIDQAVTEISQQELYVDIEDFTVLHEDARVALMKEPDKFDVVITDVFHDISIPYHLLTKEFSELVHSKQTSKGIYLLNVVDQFPDPKLVKSIVKTLQQVFLHIEIWMDHVPEENTRFTYVISANNYQKLPEQITARRGLERTWLNVSDAINDIGTPIEELPVLTDNYTPVERLMSDLLIGVIH